MSKSSKGKLLDQLMKNSVKTIVKVQRSRSFIMSTKERNQSRNLDTKVPERCPVCNKKKKNILLHIKAREVCNEKVDKQLFDKWKELSRKRTKKEYQKKYVDSGDHSKAQDKYLGKNITMNQSWYKKKLLKAKQKRLVMQRRHEFMKISSYCLMHLSRGIIPPSFMINHFKVVQKDDSDDEEGSVLSKEESMAWLTNIDTAVLEAVISLQIIVCIPNSKWISAIQTLELNEENEDLIEKVFNLIGKLQAGNNENTIGIPLPEKFHSTLYTIEWPLKNAKNNKLDMEDEEMLLKLIADILGNEEGLLHREFQELFGITDDIENLFDALLYTTNKYD